MSGFQRVLFLDFDGVVLTADYQVEHGSGRLDPSKVAIVERIATDQELQIVDGWTDGLFRGKPAADANRYRALGNSMAVPVMRWIGARIQLVDQLVRRTDATP